VAVREVRWLMSAGHSMKESVRRYLENSNDEFAADLRERWTLKWQTVSSTRAESKPFVSPYRSAFWELIERGCSGQPVLEALSALEDEIERAANADLDRHVSTLPFKLLPALLLFQFPAFLLLLLGPLWRELQQQLGG
jgi:hypothetical protein